MLVVTRYRVAEEDAVEFLARARVALEALTARPGCTGARVGRNVDDMDLWTLTTTWESVGTYRRALSAFEVKVAAVPLLSLALDEPTAYEDLLRWEGGAIVEEAYGRAEDASSAGPERR